MRHADAGWEYTVCVCATASLSFFLSFFLYVWCLCFIFFNVLVIWICLLVASCSGSPDPSLRKIKARPNPMHQMGWCHISGLTASQPSVLQCAYACFMWCLSNFVDSWHDIWSDGAQWHCSHVSCADCARVGHQCNCDLLYHWNSVITELITSLQTLLKTHRISQSVLP